MLFLWTYIVCLCELIDLGYVYYTLCCNCFLHRGYNIVKDECTYTHTGANSIFRMTVMDLRLTMISGIIKRQLESGLQPIHYY